ncbi:MAG: HAD family hydrolase [Candidatus Aramenus sp.]|nr:HAD family hydrolase [Candidatus Aramenus sp.]
MDFALTLVNTLVYVPNAKEILETVEKANDYFDVDLDPRSVRAKEDAYFLEELSYRGRIFLVTNVKKSTAMRVLARLNLDSFITRVVSAEEVKSFTTSPKFFDYFYKVTNARRGTYFVTSNKLSLESARKAGLTVVYQEGNVLRKLVEATSKKYVESKMGDSALRCT